MIPAPLKMQVRFRDIDVMGHVNNAVYLSYFEMTRVHYFEQLLGLKWDYSKDGFLLARNEIDYIRPILLTEKPEIKMYTQHIGNSSFTMGYEVLVNDVVVTRAVSVLVAYDSTTNKTIPIPTKLREALIVLQDGKSE